jgi:Fe-S cluster assembly iron-binding protein IscA
VDVIHTIADNSESPESAGLRIASPADGQERLTVSRKSSPERGDQVVESEGARVFLEPEAAAILEDKILDAHVDDQGAVQFLLEDQ